MTYIGWLFNECLIVYLYAGEGERITTALNDFVCDRQALANYSPVFITHMLAVRTLIGLGPDLQNILRSSYDMP